MRLFIMTDLEGVAGVLNAEDWDSRTGRYYESGKDLLTREVNAAIEGFLAAGATEFLVADAHGPGAILPALLHPAAELVRRYAPGSWPFALDSRPFDAIAWIGQHPKAGTVGGHLCHTGNFGVRESAINGVSAGEFGRLAFAAGELGIRSIFATGCEAFTREAQDLAPGIETVAVKRGLQSDPGHALPMEAYTGHNRSAIHLSPERARERIRAGAQRAVERARREDFGLVRLPAPYRCVTIWRSTATEPPRVSVQNHPTSVIELLKQPWILTPLAIDPADFAPGKGES